MNFSSVKLKLIGKQKELYASTFFIALLTAAAFFVPYIIADNGYFLFYGDFNVQQIPFYKVCHDAIRSGNWGWNWETDLGVNFIGSYGFYLLGSPFFWITLLFPSNFVPYLMGPLLILKFALSALTAYCYIRRFTRTAYSARLGALLYAFSGFSVYNIFFNHFHEAIIIFPLLLLSVELLITENKRGFFAAMVAVSAITNYFFFYGMVVFVVIYWIVRCLSGCYSMKVSRFLWFCFEAVLGFLMAAIIMLPTYFALYQNARLSEISVGWGGIMYGKEQIYANILECFFFPPDLPARPVFFPDADVKWSSLGGWLPLFSVVGVLACFGQKKGNWMRRLLGIMLFMAMVPILNSAFYMFNSSYYARWFYMPILIMCLATVTCIEDTEIDWSSPYKWTFGITAVFTLVMAFFPRQIENGKVIKWGLYTDTDAIYLYRFIATAAISIVSLIVLGFLLKIKKKDRILFVRTATAFVCVISVIYSAYFVGTGKSHSYDAKEVMIDSLIEGKVDLEGDKNTFRIDVFNGVDNTGMFLGYDSINAFHSIVPASVTDFWDYVGEERGVASRPGNDSYAARSLLGVKYLLARKDGEDFTDDDGKTLMPGFELIRQDTGYDIYLNKNYIPYGFTYEYYMTEDECSKHSAKDRSNMMVKAILLTNDQIKKYGKYLKNIEDDQSYKDTAAEERGADIIAENTESAEDLAKIGENLPAASPYLNNSQNSGAPSNATNGSAASDTGNTGASQSENALRTATAAQSSAATPGSNQSDMSSDNSAAAETTENKHDVSAECSPQALENDAKARRNSSAYNFKRTSDGFEADITLTNDNLVFFAVPFEDGWSANVNGENVKIEKVNKGFMAVEAKSGNNKITFSYKTPGLKEGIMISAASFAVFVVYAVICLIMDKKGKLAGTVYPEGDMLIKQYVHDSLENDEYYNGDEESLSLDLNDYKKEAKTEEQPENDMFIGYGDADFNRGFSVNLDGISVDESNESNNYESGEADDTHNSDNENTGGEDKI